MGDTPSRFHTRPSLLVRLRDARDADSWRTFVDVYGPLVFGHARRRGLRHQDAEDVTQKVFARVTQAIRNFEYRPEVGRFRDWLGTVVRNEISRFLKKASQEAQGRGGDTDDVLAAVESPAGEADWTAEFHAHILQAALVRCRPHFEEATWLAFERVWLEKRPAAKVANEMGQTVDWVYVAKSRVLKRLWEEVQELAEDTALVAGLAR